METKKFSKEKLKLKLTPLQFEVTQKCGTEEPSANEYWNSMREGIYVDIVSGEPLFSSKDKFDSGMGWPSFTKPLEKENIVEKKGHILRNDKNRDKKQARQLTSGTRFRRWTKAHWKKILHKLRCTKIYSQRRS